MPELESSQHIDPAPRGGLDARRLVRLLTFGSPATRQQLAADLLRDGATESWQLLARTIHSAEPWLLRARCLEVLGRAIAGADQQTAKQILGALRDGRVQAGAG